MTNAEAMQTEPANDDAEAPDVPSYQLNGDPRLQFWREAYLTALPVMLRQFSEAGGDSDYVVASASRAATTAADCAVAQHLGRCDHEVLDGIVFGLIAPEPTAPQRRVPQ